MKGERTRQHILERAIDVASLEGLEGLTIGRLAEELEMSKSGLFAHFGSKEELQLATVESARQRFFDAMFLPALKAPLGNARLLAILRFVFVTLKLVRLLVRVIIGPARF